MRRYRNPLAALAFVSLAGCLAARLPAVADGAGEKAEAASAPAGDSLSRNMANTNEKNVPDDFSVKKGAEKNVKWTAKLGNKSYAGPVIAGGKVFVPTDNGKPRDPKVKGRKGVLMCFRASDGGFLWQQVHDKADPDNDAQDEPLISAPWVEGDKLWYVNNRAEVICSTVEGKVVWTYDMVKAHDVFVGQHVYTSPVVIGELVYALTCNGVDAHSGKLPKPKAPSLLALNKTTGKLAWTNDLPGPNVIRGQWSNPAGAVVNGKAQVIYGGGDGYLYGLDAKSGELIWKFDCNPKKAKPYRPGGAGEKSFLIATPVIYDNKAYVAVGQEPDDGPGVGHLWCIDITKTPRNKDRDLSPVNDKFDPKDPVNKDSGLVWHHGGPVIPRPKDEGREYHFGRTMSTVAIHDGLVYAAEFAGYLQCLDAKTGEKYWEYDFQDTTWCSPYYVDGKVFMGVDSGDLYIFKAGKKLAPPKKISVGPAIKMPPVAGGGVLYLNTGSALYAIAKGK